MKHIKIIPFLLCIFSQLQAQYIPLVAENKYWFYDRAFDNPDVGGPKFVAASAITFKGDTTISGKIYKKVLELELNGKHNCQHPPCFLATIPYIINHSEVVGFIYEDTLSRKVFFLPSNDNYCQNSEHELFDFSLKKGDSLSVCAKKVLTPYNSANNIKVDSVKRDFLFNKMRNTIFLQGSKSHFGLLYIGRSQITEGVGYEDFGVLFHKSRLHAFDKFCEGSLQKCEFNTATNNLTNQLNIRIFPNPTTDKVFIESAETIETISIYDISGNILSINNQNNTLDIAHLQSGMYIIKIKLENKLQYFHKLIKL
jgi:hypothetical protein